ncbi:MAG: hypothetical protein LBD48_09185 [Treponema sp.]|jgi:hypothetical protein|nr:hypothetical protein [Treponema sp.]
MRKQTATVALFVFVLMLASQSCSGETFEQNYPIGLISYAGYPYRLTVKQLLDKNNLLNVSNEKGTVEAKIESSSVKNGVLTLTLLTSATNTTKEKTQIRSRFSFENDPNTEVCTIMYAYGTVLGSGEVTEIRHDGTQRTTGQLVGFFVASLGTFYDKEKLKP